MISSQNVKNWPRKNTDRADVRNVRESLRQCGSGK